MTTEWTQVLTIIGSILIPLFAAFGWMIFRMDSFKTEINVNLKNLSDRVSRLEGEMEHQKGMLQTIVAFLLGHKAG